MLQSILAKILQSADKFYRFLYAKCLIFCVFYLHVSKVVSRNFQENKVLGNSDRLKVVFCNLQKLKKNEETTLRGPAEPFLELQFVPLPALNQRQPGKKVSWATALARGKTIDGIAMTSDGLR